MCIHLFSQKCGTDNIEENEITDAENTDDMDNASVNSEIQEALEASDASQPSSRSSSRPSSSLSQEQEVIMHKLIKNSNTVF